MEYIILIYIVLLTGAQYLLGYILTRAGACLLPGGSETAQFDHAAMVPFYWLFGLLLHLTLAFILKCLGANWLVATALPLALILISKKEFFNALSLVKNATRHLASVPFVLWMLLQIFWGINLFSIDDGIRTPWVNNYGDLTFHLGMISHFTWQGDFPPSYHIYAGETLSYPFFVNLWATMLWRPFAVLPVLSVVFAAQWVLMWACAYVFLTFGRARFLPWVLLLGGGSLVAIVNQPDVFSWSLISKGYPWTTWLSTIWVTQRSALMGMGVCLGSAALVLNLPRFKQHGTVHIAMAGAMLGLSPLVHTHYFLVSALFLGGYLFLKAFLSVRELVLSSGYFSWRESIGLAASQHFLILFVLTCVSIFFFPLLMGKSGMAGLMLGWEVPVQPAGLGSMTGSANMWLSNATPWLLALGFVWLVSKQHLKMSLLVGLFFLGNILKLASWDWDQLKFFLAVFTLFLVVWSDYCRRELSWKRMLPHYALALALIIPGGYEAFRIWTSPPNYQVYNPVKLELAEMIRTHTSIDAIIASPADHNSAATLSGRSLFFGYPGTLASHSLNYKTREYIQTDLHKIGLCQRNHTFDHSLCPTHVIWDESAKKYWHRIRPSAEFKQIAKTKDGQYGLYEVPEARDN